MYKYLLASVFLGFAALLAGTNPAYAQKGGKGGGGGGGGGRGGPSPGAGRPAPAPGRPAPAPGRPGYAPNHGSYNGGYYRGPGVGIGIGLGIGGYAPFYSDYGYAYDPYYSPRFAYYPPATVIAQQPVPEAPVSNAASIRVLLPDAEAKVWFDGNATKQIGTERFFHTPELSPTGSYSYRLRAEWVQKGQRMVQEQVVSVAPGRVSLADFTQPFSEEIPPPPAK